MQWNLGLQAVGVLVGMSLLFGIFAQAVFWSRATRWVWLVATATFFVAGALISEWWFGWATAEELQPNIDGLSFDETLIGLLLALPVLWVVRALLGRRTSHGRAHAGGHR